MARPLMVRRAVQRYRVVSNVLWTPASIAKIIAWFNDTDASKQTLNGSNTVQQVASNNAAFIASNATVSQAPAPVSAAFTGADGVARSGLQFNPGSSVGPFRFSTVNIDIANSACFVAFKQSATSGGFMQGCEGGSRIDLYQNGYSLGVDLGGSDHTVGSSGSGAVVQFGYSSSGGTATPYVNGTAGSTFSSNTGTNAQLEAGTYAGGSGSPFRGTRGGHVLTSGMTTSEIAKLAGFWHWQLGTPLPSGSPYAARPPYVSDP